MLYDFMNSKTIVDYSIGNYRFFSDDGINYKLTENNNQWMEYNNIEKTSYEEMYNMYDLAYGDCVVSGYGFGFLIQMLISKESVNRIRVYEKSIEVIEINRRFGKIPENVEIINERIEKMKGVECDCLLMDHWELEGFLFKKENMRNIISKNNPKLVWFWTHEIEFLKWINNQKNDFTTRYGNNYDTELHFDIIYSQWLQELSIPSIPYISKDKMKLYIDNYRNKL